jgi:hypothetical protein
MSLPKVLKHESQFGTLGSMELTPKISSDQIWVAGYFG